ncbi:hypothetical protein [Nonomuraea sp. NPDC050783]|uniref:hypothetical protein n=1 Tax=Nonomuraea sp. NPDC050783 TaxID=3154634 RepID=UPI0034669AA9
MTVLGVLSVMLVGYCAATADDDDVTADCVVQLDDGTYQVVDDDYCDDDGNGSGHSTHYYGGSRGAYMWYYGGRRVGNKIQGGTTIRPSNTDVTSRSGKSIQRGGFGKSWGGGS